MVFLVCPLLIQTAGMSALCRKPVPTEATQPSSNVLSMKIFEPQAPGYTPPFYRGGGSGRGDFPEYTGIDSGLAPEEGRRALSIRVTPEQRKQRRKGTKMDRVAPGPLRIRVTPKGRR